MSNLEPHPQEMLCGNKAEVGVAQSRVELLEPREVPLGGPRAMNVRRTLPQRQRSLIGAWCFVDHYGPDEVAETGGMRVPPHPHTGLQTVSWLFTGEIEHRDSAGFHAFVRPGELNLMTAGRGICHSEVSTAETTVLHGAQLWVALPDHARFTDPGFDHYAPEPVSTDAYELRVFMGSLAGSVSPVALHSPLLGAELLLKPGQSAVFDVEESFEYGVLVDSGTVRFNGATATADQLAYLPTGHREIELTSETDEPVRLLLIGGEPMGEAIVMWWNFVGRDHDEVVEFRANWQAEIGAEAHPAAAAATNQFGTVVGNTLAPLPAPTLPNARIRPRR
ncbi:pirin family protein [Arthrobacter crystallopoietes]|uniref:Pirin n=1 Tax=Crystallibacter crystallopoietes TaxID=37928 RepID=A0A1H1AB98_9MICC|nr:pirin family protein [Arthrobacter crystallopoietes]AUI51602.1 pirin [Arthrobacter crystallopoietes]SDQ36840.1 hypothetical protein SAMN04489742_0841 [Arthrobacter crystallopoietes]